MPRPKLNKPRDRQLNVALTNDELEVLRQRAEAIGLRAVEYARAALLHEKMPAAAPGMAPSRVDRLVLEQLKRIGSNLNQIARQLNAMQGFSPAELEIALRELRRLIARLAPDDR